MRRCLVTGGAGFIGSNIVEALIARGDSVRVVDNLSTGKLSNLAAVRDRIEWIEADLSQPSVAPQVVDGIDTIFHHAALVSVPASVAAPLESHRYCVTATVQLLDAARHAGVRRLVFAASSAAYGDSPTTANRETDPPDPLSPYAAAKLACEMYLHTFASCYGLETVALRYFNVFGPRQDPKSPYSAVIPLFLTAILNNQPPTIFGDGLQSRDFVYVGNVVRANLLAAEADAQLVSGRVFNIAEGRGRTLLELLAILSRLVGRSVEPIFAPPRHGDARESMADIHAAQKFLGYEPLVGFEEGLQNSIAYYRSIMA
ncbi:MAG: SDR family oxidoreductase [Thermoguttaceae bacterium]|nr:SDR family oxidoreductase [Thermoguttaceae bacterium]